MTEQTRPSDLVRDELPDVTPGTTTSPGWIERSTTVPSKGARISV